MVLRASHVWDTPPGPSLGTPVTARLPHHHRFTMNAFAFLPLSFVLAAPAAMAQCTIAAPGAVQADFQDGWSALLPLGFTCTVNSTSYDSFFYSDHGVIALSNVGGVAPPGGPQVYDPGSLPDTIGTLGGFPVNGGGFAGFGTDCIHTYWGDHITNNVNAGDIYVDNTSGTHCTVTWRDNVPFGAGVIDNFTAQATVYASGRVVICLDDRCDNTSSAYDPITTVIGISGTGAIPVQVNLDTGDFTPDPTCFQQFDGPGPFGTNTPDPAFDVGGVRMEFLPAFPGWVVVTTPLDCASKLMFGAGCDGLALDSNEPVINTNWVLSTSGLSGISPVGITLIGTGSIPAGVLLSSLGIDSPGCRAYISGLIGSLDAPNIAGTATITIPIPNSASFKGAPLSAQSVGLSLAVPSLIVSSNGLEVIVGY
ncbi:MAG: hypothetical protein ACI8UD_002893 [Planctomycetota bacterium]|jgi:hypothetical protein